MPMHTSTTVCICLPICVCACACACVCVHTVVDVCIGIIRARASACMLAGSDTKLTRTYILICTAPEVGGAEVWQALLAESQPVDDRLDLFEFRGQRYFQPIYNKANGKCLVIRYAHALAQGLFCVVYNAKASAHMHLVFIFLMGPS
jgi:hypothetical protein